MAWFSLSSNRWLGNEHLNFEQLVSHVEGRLDDDEQEIVRAHLALCDRCREDIQSFSDHRREVEPELKIHYGPFSNATSMGRRSKPGFFHSWREALNPLWKPAYVAYALLLAVSIGAAIVLLSRDKPGENSTVSLTQMGIQTGESPVTPGATPFNDKQPMGDSKGEGSNPPTFQKTPDGVHLPGREASHASGPRNVERPMISLRDGGRQIYISSLGNIKGMEMLPAQTQKIIKETFLSEELQRPAILDDLAMERSPSRSGAPGGPSTNFISPAQAVVIENRPTFRWEPVKGATGYKVYIASKWNWASVSSPALDPSTLEWAPPDPLKRGDVYAWMLGVVTDQGEATIPASSEPERRFRVLGERDFDDLMKLKRQTDSHLALGLFYAKKGLAFEAEKEFQMLVEENAGSAFARKLLGQVRSWRNR